MLDVLHSHLWQHPNVTMKENEMENNPDVMVDIYNSSPEESVSTLDCEIQTLSIHNSENTKTATFIDNITFESENDGSNV